MNIPKHIAIIMDGNGRWAEKRGLPKVIGHKQGVDIVKNTVKLCLKTGVQYLTLYAFSTENWSRPDSEIKALFQLLENFIDNEIKLFHDNKIKFCIIGERSRIQKDLLAKVEKTEKDTSDYHDLTLNIALSYGARQEILNAARILAQDAKSGKIDPKDIDEKMFSSNLYTAGQPDPDLLIRTSGEMRVSNFLLWQISYSELYVTETLWPDFDEREFNKAIETYSKRDRRFGGR
ncbi:MAG: isoprenyl transferase [Candidatus Omnitrophica bacterium CG_4_9_14_0_2_um_filter_42_8]|nr:MAG: isoprenyl transferase [Candidatus Omnitrophica bacterium CG22_combo_CG10-13_8_21_14_all_43_16]PJC48790.1 MAG: isoprenyl transferase [Candidatus Omnitrophica bacterium CG_4_9_14_0_2_um_filter_42_8]